MMGNSFRDPLFRAKLESERERNPHLTEVIEDKCTTCHTPMAKIQAHWDGASYFTLAEAESSELAQDGVSCTLCHQIQDVYLGSSESFTGKYKIDDRRDIYGPYQNVMVGPMRNNVNYTPIYGRHVNESALCATCHTLFTPYVNDEGQVAGEFPEQTPYLEWLNSQYASGDNAKSCQDCHMPRIDEAIQISRRPPWFNNTQSPFWKHHFAGGNKFVLQMMRANASAIGATASDTQFQTTIQRTDQQLVQNTAEISIVSMERDRTGIRLTIAVKNLTGHKFPTGFPSRRAWLRVQMVDGLERTLFTSGDWTETGEIVGLDEGFEPHYDIITSSDQVQIYEGIMGDVKDQVTYTLLRGAKYLKDNRLVPQGYNFSGPMAPYTGLAGSVILDENFNKNSAQEGTGIDWVTYAIPIENAQFPIRIETQLLYQTASPRFIEDLMQNSTSAIIRFEQMYSLMNYEPVVIDSLSLQVDSLKADLDQNGWIDMSDFSIFSSYWQRTACGLCGGADLTGDGNVILDDWFEFLIDWTLPVPPSSKTLR